MVYQAWKSFPGNEVIATSPFSNEVFDFIGTSGRVLDLGCGNGRISKLIKKHGYQVYGIDINKDAILFAQGDPSLSGAEFSVQDAKQTSFSDNFFDAVIEQATLGCMEPEERAFVLQEIHRILKPDGVVSITEFGIRSDRTDEYRQDAVLTGEYGTHIVKREDGSEWFRVHNFEENELENLIEGSGFQILSESHPTFSSLKGNSHPSHRYTARKIK